jgi:phosphate-selective porin OprO/OprP
MGLFVFGLPVFLGSFQTRATAAEAEKAADGQETATQVDAEKEKSVTEKILDRMLESKEIDQPTYDAWSAQAAAEASRLGGGPDDWTFLWKDGFRLSRDDGLFKLRFGGRIQLDVAGIGESQSLQRVPDMTDGEGFGTEFRRSRIYFSGTMGAHLLFKVQYDFAGGAGGTDFKDVYLGLRNLPHVGQVRVGHFKEPFSLEEMTSSNTITFMERSLISAFNPARNTGVIADRTFCEDSIYFGAGGFILSDDFGQNFSHDAKYSITTRLAGQPIYEEDGERLLHVGAAYNHRFLTDYRVRQRPEAHLAQRYVDTGTFLATDVDLFSGAAALVQGPLSVQAEISGAFVHRGTKGRNVSFWGFYGETSYFLTGEHRQYDRKKAVFKGPKPKKPFNTETGDAGAVQAVARYSWLNLNDEDIRGGIINDVSLGLNWYLYSNTRVMLNYIHSVVHDVGHANILQARFQIAF